MCQYATHLRDVNSRFLREYSQTAGWEVVGNYFDHIGLEEAQYQLWKLTVGLLSNDELEEVTTGRERLNTIYFFEYTNLLIQVVHYLHSFQKKCKKKKVKKIISVI